MKQCSLSASAAIVMPCKCTKKSKQSNWQPQKKKVNQGWLFPGGNSRMATARFCMLVAACSFPSVYDSGTPGSGTNAIQQPLCVFTNASVASFPSVYFSLLVSFFQAHVGSYCPCCNCISWQSCERVKSTIKGLELFHYSAR